MREISKFCNHGKKKMDPDMRLKKVDALSLLKTLMNDSTIEIASHPSSIYISPLHCRVFKPFDNEVPARKMCPHLVHLGDLNTRVILA
jgi:hypothetical protein